MSERVFTPDLFFGLRQPASRVPMHLHPDGRSLSLTVQTRGRGKQLTDVDTFTEDGVSGEMVASRVMVVSEEGHAEEPFDDATSWAGIWSPDGRRIAAYVQSDGPACLATWERAAGQIRMFPDVHVRPVFGFEVPRWTPDSRTVVVKVRAARARAAEPQSADPPSPAVRTYAFDPDNPPEASGDELPGWGDGYICDLAAVDVEKGDVTTLVRDWRVIGWEISPAGDAVAVLRYVDWAQETQNFIYDLSVVPLDASPPFVLASSIPQEYGTGFSWSPDGDSIAYTTTVQGEPTRLYVVASDGSGPPRDLTDPNEEMHLTDHLPPRWSPDSRQIIALASHGHWDVSIDGSTRRQINVELDREVVHWVQRPGDRTVWYPLAGTIWYVIRNSATKEMGLARVSDDDGKSDILFEIQKSIAGAAFDMEVTPDGSCVYLLVEGADHPPELWRVDGGTPRRLLSFNPKLDGVGLGTRRLIEYHGYDGQALRASIVLPPEHQDGERLPVLVDVYGGSIDSGRLHRFDGHEGVMHPQLLTARGYAVVYPDAPLADRDPLRQLPGLVLPAVDELVRLGIADPDRIAVMGNSYGGYCALGLLVQTRRFRAGVASAAFSNLISAYLSMDEQGNANWLGWAESGQGQMGGTPWEKRDSYIENSPVFYLDRVRTPLLLVRGSEDSVPAAEAEAVFVGLRRLGRTVELREYEGEGHWPGMWTEEAYLDFHDRVLSWFDRWLND